MSASYEGKSPLICFAIDYCKANSIPFTWNGSFLVAYKPETSLSVTVTNHGTIGFLGNYMHDVGVETVKRVLDNLL